MKHPIYLFLTIVLFASCSIDNYDMPSLTLTGRIVDSETNEPVESGGLNAGTIIKMYENGSAQPLLYKTLPDGSFSNTAVFPGTYAYTAEGPFRLVSPDQQSITISGNTELEIKVIPYVRLTASLLEKSGTTATIKVQYQKVKQEDVLANLGFIYSTFPNPNSFTSAGGAVRLENVESAGLTTGEMTYTITDMVPGKKYYIRAAANTINPGNYYNYSSQIEISVP